MLPRRQFLALASAAAAYAQQTSRKPNIVLVLADDLGYGNLGCYGQQQIRTPHIDQLAREGMRFTQAYAGSTVCAPSRCCLMTGKHTGHAFIRGNKRVSLRPQDVTMAEVLQKQGYRTGLFGKWGLGTAVSTGTPNRKGFDEFYGYLDQQHAHNYYPHTLWHNEEEVNVVKNWGPKPSAYSHDLIQEQALQWLGKQTPERPFFAYLAFTLPHANNEAHSLHYAEHGLEVPTDEPYSGQPWPAKEKAFAAMVSRLDDTVGAVMAALHKQGLDQNTLVVFSSDNGPHREGGHDPQFFHDSGPLRGIKRDLYEGGIRVPFIARWPGRVRPESTSPQPIAFWDLLPTFAELAGGAAPAGIDGRSMAPVLLGQPLREQRRVFYWEFHENGFSQAVRQDDWKLVRLKRKQTELYNLGSDEAEQRNVAAEQPDVVQRLTRQMDQAHIESAEFPVEA